jgi:RNA polymerase sigma-70 factor (ECF subfamily)
MSYSHNFQSTLTAAQCGAEWAWAALYRDLAGPIKAYFSAHGAADPEDLAGEVFFQAARDISRFHGDEASFRSWLFVIAHRRLVDSWRAAGRRAPHIPLDDVVAEPEGGDAETEAVDRLITGELLTAFKKLSDDQRAVVSLRIIGGLTLEETARVLGKRVGAIKALQRRALLALRESLPEVE